MQSSLRKQLGLATDERRVGPAERGIAEMMVDLYRCLAERSLKKAVSLALIGDQRQPKPQCEIMTPHVSHVSSAYVRSGNRPGIHRDARAAANTRRRGARGLSEASTPRVI